MRLVLFLCIFIFSVSAYSQQADRLDYQSLQLLEKTSSLPVINNNYNKEFSSNQDYFFTNEYDGERSLFFIKKVAQEYLIYKIETGHYGAWTSCEIKSIDKQFVSIQSYRTYGGSCAANYGQSIILDLDALKYISFFHYESTVCDDENGDRKSFYECKTSFELKGDLLKLKQESTENHVCEYCIESSYYQKTEEAFVKSHYYSENHDQYFEYRCLQNLCRGMTLKRLKSRFKKSQQLMVKAYKYAYDSDADGIKFSDENKDLFFITHDKRLVTGITFLASTYSFDGITTGKSIESVLKKYPSKLYIDLLTNNEYIAIDALQIRLVFMTNDANRIGKYKGPDSAAVAIIRKDACIDMIQMN